MTRARELPFALLALLATACAPTARDGRLDLSFEPAVGNIEQVAATLWPHPADERLRLPGGSGIHWHGRIPRRLPEEAAAMSQEHFVPFMAAYDQGVAVEAWCDTDLDGDLSDESSLPLASHPSGEAARSFLVTLHWMARHAGREIPIHRTLRVVLESQPDPPGARGPRYRVQSVFAMMGAVRLEGRSHRAFLLDGDHDGLYTAGLSDGLFVDLDDDGHVVTDPMSPEFGSLRVPFTMGRRSWQADEIDPQGRFVRLVDRGAAGALADPPAVGQAAPEFSFVDSGGRRVSLADQRGRWVFLYFWASWCATCEGQAEELRQLREAHHPHGFEILGISYDSDRAAMEAFRSRHGHAWPTSFSGRALWEDPIGRLYRQRDSGVGYLVRPDGVLDSAHTSVPGLAGRLREVLSSPPPAV